MLLCHIISITNVRCNFLIETIEVVQYLNSDNKKTIPITQVKIANLNTIWHLAYLYLQCVTIASLSNTFTGAEATDLASRHHKNNFILFICVFNHFFNLHNTHSYLKLFILLFLLYLFIFKLFPGYLKTIQTLQSSFRKISNNFSFYGTNCSNFDLFPSPELRNRSMSMEYGSRNDPKNITAFLC